jgi:hypothetical protein
VWFTQACFLVAAFTRPDGVIWFTIFLLVFIAFWPWMFGHGG